MNPRDRARLIAAYKAPSKRKPRVYGKRKPRVIKPPFQTSIKPHMMNRFGIEPICPRCECVGFDDWWHVLEERKSGKITGNIECPLCEKMFHISGVPGSVNSSAYGLDQTDILMRKAGL